jgi:hypothetical protein
MGAAVSSRSQGGLDKSLTVIDVIVVDAGPSKVTGESLKFPPNIVKVSDV